MHATDTERELREARQRIADLEREVAALQAIVAAQASIGNVLEGLGLTDAVT